MGFNLAFKGLNKMYVWIRYCCCKIVLFF